MNGALGRSGDSAGEADGPYAWWRATWSQYVPAFAIEKRTSWFSITCRAIRPPHQVKPLAVTPGREARASTQPWRAAVHREARMRGGWAVLALTRPLACSLPGKTPP